MSFQEEIQTALTFLEKKLEDFNEVKLTSEKIKGHIEVQYSTFTDRFNALGSWYWLTHSVSVAYNKTDATLTVRCSEVCSFKISNT